MSMHILASQMQDGVGIGGGYTGVVFELVVLVTTTMSKPTAGMEVDVTTGQGWRRQSDLGEGRGKEDLRGR
jgi:hypothetical protein